MDKLAAAVANVLKHPKIVGLDQTLVPLAGASDADAVKSICLAFLKGSAGDKDALAYLGTGAGTKFADTAKFFSEGIGNITDEVANTPADLIAHLEDAATGDASGTIEGAQGFWKAFFPNGVGMMDDPAAKVAELRKKRTITNLALNPNPISDPIKQVLFTSNVLLGLPMPGKAIDSLPYSADFKAKLEQTAKETQVAWFDHPIPIGIEPEGNEILYGLIGLDQAVAWEKEKGNIPADAEMLTALSITCTHTGLQGVAKQYVEEEFAAMPEAKKLKHLKVMLFSELETNAILEKVLTPAMSKVGNTDVEAMREVFGVEGQYGRHYSFLKAVLAVYNAFVDSSVTATFKIDIDQLFIQDSLMKASGESALTHFKTPLWGATGKNWRGEDVELGMMAGALCNQKDHDGAGGDLWIADVQLPKKDKALAADELIFFSGLPQAVSTEAEMMTKYASNDDVIQRIHVTGGTNGILVDTLLKFRPFCPSFIGRAEDQSYIFSTFGKAGKKLAYVHKPGLIMRHDKEAFAAEAMEVARIGKMVGDYERILMFSEYGKFCSGDFNAVMDLVNPFTGCFCIPMPKTVMYLRFALKSLGFVAAGVPQDAIDFTLVGSPRVAACIEFTKSAPGAPSKMETQWKKEQKTWDVFYDALAAAKGDADISAAAKVIFDGATAKK